MSLLLRLRYITPTCGIVGTAEIMLDAITEHTCLTFAVLCRILLWAEYDGLTAVLAIDAVNDLVQPFQLLIAHRGVVKQIGLYAILRADAHHDDACTFVLKALAEDALCASQGTLHDVLCLPSFSKLECSSRLRL